MLPQTICWAFHKQTLTRTQPRKELNLARSNYYTLCKARSLWLQTIRYQEVRRDAILKSLTDGVFAV